jgi:2-polyprenyl-3-methyl-5-hydroxy-6-metoxy-1,4-benzoquinol methylase
MTFFSQIFAASRDARRERIYKPRLSTLLKFCSKYECLGGSFMEIGAGSGDFCRLVSDAGIFSRCLAVEASAEQASNCRALGLDTVESPIEHFVGEEGEDVVAAFEVIEHLFSPENFILSLRRLLSDGGLCFLTTPNSFGPDVLELGKNSTTVDITHLTIFNTKSNRMLMERNGFCVLEIVTPGLLDVDLLLQAWKSGQGPLSPFLAYMLQSAPESVAVNFQQFLCEHGLSSHMWIVAQKR